MMKDKYFTTFDYNMFMNNTLDAKITEKKLVTESDLNEKIKTSATKEETRKISNKGKIKGRAKYSKTSNI